MAKRYSLANYIVTITINDSKVAAIFGDQLQIGGEGSYTDSISVGYSNSLYDIAADKTGSYVFNKNLDKSGTVSISLAQVSDKVAKLRTLFNLYVTSSEELDTFTITVSSETEGAIATCEDCLLAKMPNQEFDDASKSQTWEFVCGKITFVN